MNLSFKEWLAADEALAEGLGDEPGPKAQMSKLLTRLLKNGSEVGTLSSYFQGLSRLGHSNEAEMLRTAMKVGEVSVSAGDQTSLDAVRRGLTPNTIKFSFSPKNYDEISLKRYTDFWEEYRQEHEQIRIVDVGARSMKLYGFAMENPVNNAIHWPDHAREMEKKRDFYVPPGSQKDRIFAHLS